MKKLYLASLLVTVAVLFMAEDGCEPSKPQAASGVTQASARVQTGSDGLTVEQRNVKNRLEEDNKPGSIKHLYIISPYSGQVILYSTVKGKVTSGGKRLTPTTVVVGASGEYRREGFQGPSGTTTGEVLQDDGTYGQSGDYLYWWDVRGVYHQHYLTGGQIVHVTSAPMPIKSVILNLEVEK